MRAAACWLVLALLAAGCLERGTEDDAGSASGGSDRPPVLAFFDTYGEGGRNQTLLVLREEGAVDRLTYLADGSWLPRLAPGLEYPATDLATLFARPPGGNERGGLVLRIETGRADVPERAVIEEALGGEWPRVELPADERHPYLRPIVVARADPLVVAEVAPWTEDAPGPDAERLMALHEAFEDLAASFVADDVDETELTFMAPWGGGDGRDGCLRARTTATNDAAHAGDVIEVRAEVENCGDEEAVLDPARCDAPPAAQVHVGGGAILMAVVPQGDAPQAAFAVDGACRGGGETVRIPAGGSATLVRRWNGTLAACRAPADCAYRPAPPGEYAFFTFASGQDEASPATVTLLPREGPTMPLLVARESDWLNTTSSEHIGGDFGPHCAPVDYTRDPASVTFWYVEGDPTQSEGVVVRDWRASETPPNVRTFSADRLDMVLVEENGTMLASPFEGARPFVEVRVEGEDFLVNGTRLGVGDALTLAFAETLERPGGTFELTSTITFENLGRAAVLFQQPFGCA